MLDLKGSLFSRIVKVTSASRNTQVLVLQGHTKVLRASDWNLSNTPQLWSLSSELLAVSSPEVDKSSQAVVMPQQLLITLPTKASTWVKLQHPKKATEGVPLWEDVTKMFEGKGENGLMEGGRRGSHLCGKRWVHTSLKWRERGREGSLWVHFLWFLGRGQLWGKILGSSMDSSWHVLSAALITHLQILHAAGRQNTRCSPPVVPECGNVIHRQGSKISALLKSSKGFPAQVPMVFTPTQYLSQVSSFSSAERQEWHARLLSCYPELWEWCPKITPSLVVWLAVNRRMEEVMCLMWCFNSYI